MFTLFCAAVLGHVKTFLFGYASVKVVLAAIPGFGGAASYDQSSGTHLDLSDELSAVLLADVFFLGRIPVKGEARAVDHYWIEDVLNATTLTLTASYASGDATITVASTAGIQIGALLVNQDSGSLEVLQVTAINSSTVLAVNRGVGDNGTAAAASLGSTDKIRIVSQPKQEGDTNVNDVSTIRPRKQNTCQIFKKEVEISGTMFGLDLAGVPDEYNYQLAHRTLELRRELGQAVILGVQVTNGGAGGSDAVIRSMDGAVNRVRQQASQLFTATSVPSNSGLAGNANGGVTDFSEILVNAMYRVIYEQGGEADYLAGNADQMTKFAELYKDKVRLAPNDRQRGLFVTKFLTNLGNEIDLVIDRWFLFSTILMGDSKRQRLVPLKGRAWQAQPLAKQGDSMRGMLVGEYTAEWRNAAQCFSLATGLTK